MGGTWKYTILSRMIRDDSIDSTRAGLRQHRLTWQSLLVQWGIPATLSDDMGTMGNSWVRGLQNVLHRTAFCTFSWLNKTKFKCRISEVTHFPKWRLALMWKVIQVVAVLAAVLRSRQRWQKLQWLYRKSWINKTYEIWYTSPSCATLPERVFADSDHADDIQLEVRMPFI